MSSDSKIIRVLDEGLNVVINSGSDKGISVGDIFLILSESKDDIIDPTTQKNLGKLEIIRGRAEVTHVQETMATLTSLEYGVCDKRDRNDILHVKLRRPHSHDVYSDEQELVRSPIPNVEIADKARLVEKNRLLPKSAKINISKFEREIAAEYMSLFGSEIDALDKQSTEFTIQIMNIAATSAAIAIRLYSDKVAKNEHALS